jgi:hypothetical protein
VSIRGGIFVPSSCEKGRGEGDAVIVREGCFGEIVDGGVDPDSSLETTGFDISFSFGSGLLKRRRANEIITTLKVMKMKMYRVFIDD